MTFELNDDQRQIHDLIRRVAREKIAPRAQEIDATGEYPHDMFELLKELGLFTCREQIELTGLCTISIDRFCCCWACGEVGNPA